MISRRDIVVALLAVGATVVAVTGYTRAPVMQSSIFEWSTIAEKQTEVGSVRNFFRAQTATLDELECHVTTLKPGMQAHAPHKHVEEELVIVKEGTIEALVNGEWKKAGPGSVVFNYSNQLHGIRNAGAGPASYHVIRWSSPGMLKKQP